MTICTRCKYLLNIGRGDQQRQIWYNHLCRANPLPLSIDPYDGELKHFGRNDLGGVHVADRSYDFCRNHNDGNCSKFEEIEDANARDS